jgi:hypothetical protein
MRHRVRFVFIIFISLFGCGKTERVDTQAVKEEIKQREIRKISEVEIFDKATSLAKHDEQVILDCLNKKVTSGIENYSIPECFQQKDTARILSGRLFLGTDTIGKSEMENALISAYQYDFNKKQSLYPNLQDLKNNQFLYSFPIYKNDSIFSLKETKAGILGVVLLYYRKKEVVKSLY